MAKRRSKKPRNYSPRRPRRAHRINHEINVSKVRLVKVEELGLNLKEGAIYSTSDALGFAEETEKDLVEIVAKADPPVCRIVEYSKFKYELKKKQKESKSKQHTVIVKEIRFGPNTDDHDFNFKLNHAKKFLSEGNKLKAYVQFRGRNIIYKNQGFDMLQRFAAELEEYGRIEVTPKMEGRRMIMIMAPGKKK